MNQLLEAALEYAALGWPVFPLRPRMKVPYGGTRGFKDAVTDPVTIRAWWDKKPQSNIGIATGKASFDVLDVDGPEGRESLERLQIENQGLPPGPQQITARGRQYLFAGGTLGVSAGRIPGLDTRGEGGYIVAAPSTHPSGADYVFEDFDEPIPRPPRWLTEALKTTRSAPAFSEPLGPMVAVDDDVACALLEMAGIPLSEIHAGCRNDQLFRWGSSLRARGMGGAIIERILRLANWYLAKPPLPAAEIHTIAASAARFDLPETHRSLENE